jgi:hypothetical protein
VAKRIQRSQKVSKWNQKTTKSNQKTTKWSQKGKKRPKYSKMERKVTNMELQGAKREPKGDQSGSKNRLGRQGRFREPKSVTAENIYGTILVSFGPKRFKKSMQNSMSKKTSNFMKKPLKKGAQITA